jgi:hypothetical protein
MKLVFDETPEQKNLAKALGSKDNSVSIPAQEAFAAQVGPIVQEVINQASLAQMIYQDMTYNEDDYPSILLDQFYDQAAGYIPVWTQNAAGGMPASLIEGVAEMKVSTYRIDSAMAVNKKFLRRARLNVLAKGIERMAQEVLLHIERNSWAVILKALGEAATAGTKHTITTSTQDIFIPHDLNRLFTRIIRINESFANGTPDPALAGKGITDMFVSPEIMEQIRGFAYTPINPVTANQSAPTTAAVTVPDSVRQNIWNSAGAKELWGVVFHQMNELGVNKKYIQLFSQFATANIAHGPSTFDPTDDDLLIGFDLSKYAFIRNVEVNADSGAQFVAESDDQFYAKRMDKMGLFGSVSEGRTCVDARKTVGLVI